MPRLGLGLGVGLGVGTGVGLRASVGGGGGFVGPYDDIPSITAAYGMRRLLSSYESSILRVRRSSDNTEQDIGYTSAGDLDTAAIATFIGAGSGYVVTWYDQSGNGNNATQSTAAAQPLYVASGKNSKPVLRFDGSDDHMVSSSAMSCRHLLVVKSMGNSNNGRYFIDLRTGIANAFIWDTTDASELGSHWTDIRRNGSSALSFFAAGWDVMTFSGTNTGTETLHLVARSANNFGHAGDIAELVIASAPWSAGDVAGAETAANNYWSVY